MTFNNRKKKDMEAMWMRLSGIICNQRPKEYNKFLGKVHQMQKVLSPKEVEQRKKQLRNISSTRRVNIGYKIAAANAA